MRESLEGYCGLSVRMLLDLEKSTLMTLGSANFRVFSHFLISFFIKGNKASKEDVTGLQLFNY